MPRISEEPSCVTGLGFLRLLSALCSCVWWSRRLLVDAASATDQESGGACHAVVWRTGGERELVAGSTYQPMLLRGQNTKSRTTSPPENPPPLGQGEEAVPGTLGGVC
jgi:hypothetical protein